MIDSFGHDFSLGRVCVACGKAWSEQELSPSFCLNATQVEKVVDPQPVPQQPDIKGLTSIIIAARMTSYPLFHYTGNTIGSVKEHTTLPYEIIFVDNGSPIKLEPEKIGVDKVIQNTDNLGVAKAWNQGVRVSQGEYLVFLNNDAQVYDNWLEDFHESLEHLKLVMATPMYGMPFARAVESEALRDKWKDLPIQESFDNFTDFSCVGLKKQTVRDLYDFEREQGFETVDNGLFDERFFAYCEDVDLRERMIRAGMQFASTKRVNTFHIIHATGNELGDDAKIMNESKEKFAAKWPIRASV